MLCRRDACVEGVVEDGVNGWQYEDAPDFARHLREFCADAGLRRRMSQAAWVSAGKFSAEAFGEAAERLYQSVQDQPMPIAAGSRW